MHDNTYYALSVCPLSMPSHRLLSISSGTPLDVICMHIVNKLAITTMNSNFENYIVTIASFCSDIHCIRAR